MNEETFHKWLITEECKSPHTAVSYLSAIRQMTKHYNEFKKEKVNLFLLGKDKITEIRKLYDVDGEFSTVGEKGSKGYINSIKALERFKNNTPKKKYKTKG